MLLSMTGHGEACVREAGLVVTVELRTINSRFVKVSVRTTEGNAALEPLIESFLREFIRRGTIQASVRIDRVRPLEDYQINVAVLDRYRQQLEALNRQWNLPGAVSLESLLALPGVVQATSTPPRSWRPTGRRSARPWRRPWPTWTRCGWRKAGPWPWT